MRIPLSRGRDFRDSDDQNSQRVAIINQAMADRYWHGQDPLGRRFSIASDPNHSLEIVGVVQNSRQEAYSTEFNPFFYLPGAQHYEPFGTLQVRTTVAPEAIAHEMIGLVHSLESAMPVLDVQPMTAALETANGFLIFQFGAALAASLGALGLLLAIVGVYGVISYAASHRAHEIGVRMALGAQPRQVLWMILRQGFGIVALGVLIGVFAAAAIAKMVGNLLINVSPTDPQTYVAAALLLALVALAACYIPALRAVRVDPMTALRYE
jgi:putative ABC transport system permease protein